MRALPGVLAGAIVFEPRPDGDTATDHADPTRTFDAELARSVGVDGRNLVQEYRIRLDQGAVHGLSLRTDGGEGLLVSCCAGSVLGVGVDLRPGSVTYRTWMSVVLDDVGHRSVWLPPGLAHGYQALSASATVCWRANRVRQPLLEAVIAPDDAQLAIPWPLPPTRVAGAGAGGSAPFELAMVEPFLGDWFGALA